MEKKEVCLRGLGRSVLFHYSLSLLTEIEQDKPHKTSLSTHTLAEVRNCWPNKMRGSDCQIKRIKNSPGLPAGGSSSHVTSCCIVSLFPFLSCPFTGAAAVFPPYFLILNLVCFLRLIQASKTCSELIFQIDTGDKHN